MLILAETVDFSTLVHEAFIAPIRSVLIVDDQYPTWNEILNECMVGEVQNSDMQTRSSIKAWRSQPNGPLSVIKQFRVQNPGLIIDIHDGINILSAEDKSAANVEGEQKVDVLADHLHQSDLLVLDYNLEGAGSGLGGEKARKILQSVLSNNHFNLVVVHTDEKNFDDVFFDCLISTMTSCTSQFDEKTEQALSELTVILDEKGDEEEFSKDKVLELFSQSSYLMLRDPKTDPKTVAVEFMKSAGILASISEYGKEIKLKGKNLRSFFYWAIREFEKTKLGMFADQVFEGLTWKNDAENKWLRTDRGFVTFVEKGPYDLLGALQSALVSWQPTPSRLISAKYRYELSSVGVVAEDRTLAKIHVFAQFYKDFCSPGRTGRPTEEVELLRGAMLKAHVSRQSETISSQIEDNVAHFGEKIRLSDEESDTSYADHYGVSLEDSNSADAKKAVAHYNSYVSTLTLKTDGDHLDSGHIFKMNGNWWVCATPACDLQPGQNTTAFIGCSASQRPFTALQLTLEEDLEKITNAHINSGLFCFVESAPGEVICLGVHTRAIPNGKSTWRSFVANNSGLITDSKIQLAVPKLKGENFIIEDAEAVVVAKLRYEYALNYIQKVGASVTRIGLGYTSLIEETPQAV